MEYKDYYKILGVERDASQADIKKAYRRLARKYHPDVSKETDAEQKFKDINEANEVLKDTEKRQAYDALGADWQNGQSFDPPPGWDFYGQNNGTHQAHSFSDFFENLFSGGFDHAGFNHDDRGHGFHSQQHQPHVQDAGSVQISLEEAFNGARRQLNLQEPVYETNGQVRLNNRTLTINIPKGAQDGQRLRIPTGSGNALTLTVEHLPHRRFQTEGKDITYDLKITPWEAALGTKLNVPTLSGTVQLNIPAGSQSGNKLRLKGKGLPGKSIGDQYVTLQIMTPPANSSQARELYERMKNELAYNPRETV